MKSVAFVRFLTSIGAAACSERRRLSSFGALAACLSFSAPSSAHAPPQATAIQWLPEGGEAEAVVRTNRGLIFQESGTGRFSILCGEAFESTVTETAPFAVAGDGTLLVGSYEGGLQHSRPDWCSFDDVTDVSGVYTADIQSSPQDPDNWFAVALPLDGSSAQLFNRPSGSTWRSIATLDGAPSSLRVASADPRRVYVVSMRSEGERQIADVLASSDGGTTFATSSLELEPEEIRAYLLEAGQGVPDRVLLRTQTADGLVPERLLLSEDGGRTFREIFRAQGPLSLVTAPDAASVWVGGFDGLFRSADGGASFTSVEGAPQRVGCLAFHAGKLYVCGHADGEFGVLASEEPTSQPFAWFLRFPDVQARLSCGAESDEARACQYPFEDWAAEQLESSAPSGGGDSGESGAPGSPSAGSAGNPPAPITSSGSASGASDSASCSLGAQRLRTPQARSLPLWLMFSVLVGCRRLLGRKRTTQTGAARSLKL